MINRDLLASLRPEDMPTEETQHMATLIGVENTMKLLHAFSGQRIYLPKYWQKNVVQKWVSVKYEGDNVKQLSKDLDVCEDTVRKSLNKKRVRPPWAAAPPAARNQQLNLL